MSKKCPKCESKDIHITVYPYPTDNMATCYGCGYADLAERFPEQTIFDSITSSPEVLAEKLVFWEGGWTSRFIQFTSTNREEAIAATLGKLKEPVSNDYAGSMVEG